MEPKLTDPVPPANTCRYCEEPTPLAELRDLDGLCADCESEQNERLRQDAWDSHFADLAEDREFDRTYGDGGR